MRRSPRRRALAATSAVVCALITASPATAPASTSQFTLFEAPRELLSHDQALRTQTLDEIQSLGARAIRLNLYWKSVAPTPDSKYPPIGFEEDNPDHLYDWSGYDRAIGEASQRGLDVLVTLTGPVPTWATGSRSGHTYKPRASHFERFVTAVGRRYGAQVKRWSVWNEPNHPEFLTPQFVKGRAVSPGVYRGLVRAAIRGLTRSGNTADTVLAGETAPRGTPRVVAPLRFLRGALCLSATYVKRASCGRLAVDGWAHHPYTTKAGPAFRPRNRDDVTIGVLSRLTRALDRASAARAIPSRMRVYLTEFGVQSQPDPYVGVSERQQAEFRSIAENIAFRNPRVHAFSQYLMRDDEPRAGSAYARYSGFESGLRHSNGTVKLAYDAFRLPLVAERSGSRVALWGVARPALAATVVEIDYANAGATTWRYLKRDTTDARGAWSTTTRFRKGRAYRVRWNGFEGPRTRVYDLR